MFRPYLLLIGFILCFVGCEADVSSEEALAKFMVWYRQCLKDNPNIPNEPKMEVRAAPGMGMGTFALEDIKAETLYMYTPWDCVMNEDTIRKSKLKKEVFDDIMSKTGRKDEFHELLLFLLYERFVNPKSHFKPYIDSIPKTFEFPFFWEMNELERVKSSLVYQDIVDDRNRATNTYYGVKQFVLDKYPKQFPPEHFTLENYLWARAILNSRAIWMANIPGKRNLVPLLDMINCAEGPNPKRLHRSAKDNNMNSVVTLSPWDFKKGEQTFENYGQPNYQYFMYHGFVMDGNSHDCVRIELFVSPSAPNKDKTIEKLKSEQLQERIVVCLNRNDMYGKGIQKAYKFISIIEPNKNRDEVLLKYIKFALARYTNSIAKDRDFLKSPLASSRGKTARKLIMYEKILLKELFDRLKKRTERLGGEL